jgi:hypothetical protein
MSERIRGYFDARENGITITYVTKVSKKNLNLKDIIFPRNFKFPDVK